METLTKLSELINLLSRFLNHVSRDQTMETLTKQSKAIIKRFKVHRDRCLKIERTLGSLAALRFHLKWKANPGSMGAKAEFGVMVNGN